MSGADMLRCPQVKVHTVDQHSKRGEVIFSGPEVDYRLDDATGILRVLKWVNQNRTGDSLYLPGTFVGVERSKPTEPAPEEPETAAPAA